MQRVDFHCLILLQFVLYLGALLREIYDCPLDLLHASLPFSFAKDSYSQFEQRALLVADRRLPSLDEPALYSSPAPREGY